ncbi:hypothetical protein DL96DRAFT_1628279 [Flagelloscypha sp. PMI_526]|nr:hypothetical protein DL96DRAFT_1628279 [Flagelloscypha sp. PMI_526]
MATTRTPIRALPSALKSPSGTPSVASLNDKAAKWKTHLATHGLRPRIYRVLGFNTFVALVWSWIWAGGVNADLWSVVPWWAVVVLGVVGPWCVVRWRLLSVTRSPSLSPSATFSNPHKAQILLLLTTTTSLLALYGLSQGTLPLFVKSRKHPFYLNGTTMYLILNQIVLSIVYTTRILATDVFLFPFQGKRMNSYPGFQALLVPLIPAILLVIPVVLCTLSAFVLIRVFLLRALLALPPLNTLLRPFVAHFLSKRSAWTFTLPFTHLPTILKGVSYAFVTSWMWDVFGFTVFEDLMSGCVIEGGNVDEVIAAVCCAENSDGMRELERYFALVKLRDICSGVDKKGRESIYTTPVLYTPLVRTLLLLFGRDYQHLIRRGAPPPPPATPAPAKPIVAPPKTPLKTNPFKSTPATAAGSPLQNVINSVLLDDGDVNKVVSSIPTPRPTDGPATATSATTNLLSSFFPPLLHSITQQLPHLLLEPRAILANLQKWYHTPHPQKRLAQILHNAERDILIIQILSDLTANSLEEDLFGVLQRDLTKVVEALILFLHELELLRSDNSLFVGGGIEAMDNLEETCKNGLARIVRTFGRKRMLGSFKWPDREVVTEGVRRWCDFVG